MSSAGGRRWLVLGAVAVVAVMAAILIRSASALHPKGARIAHFTISSRFVHGTMAITTVAPAGGGRNRPLLVFLHGRGADHNSELSDQLFTALAALGGRAPDIVFPNGGDHSYWHDRADGAWAEYVLREVIPAAQARLHPDPRRIAIGGISMGGFGAYEIARQSPGRFCAIGGHSAAMWTSGGDSAPGAFDDAADFARNDVIAAARAHPGLYGRAALWLDGGDQDPFHVADETFARALGIHMHVWPGAHDSDYWNAHIGAYLRFYAGALGACKRA